MALQLLERLHRRFDNRQYYLSYEDLRLTASPEPSYEDLRLTASPEPSYEDPRLTGFTCTMLKIHCKPLGFEPQIWV